MWSSICRFKFLAAILPLLFGAGPSHGDAQLYYFTPADKRFLAQFSLDRLDQLPHATSNRYVANEAAAKLGQALFFDPRLSANGEIACSHCHQPEHYFSDNRPQSRALGTTRRNAPSLIGAAYGPWKYWDGRKDSLWAQALEPLESPTEHGLTRSTVVKRALAYYGERYRAVFGSVPANEVLAALPAAASPAGNPRARINWETLSAAQQRQVNMAFANLGKAIMAYEHRLQPLPARFDRFLAAVRRDAPVEQLQTLFAVEEVRGLRLFVGRAGCASCHNGPLLTNFEFHNVGVPEADLKNVDLGRYAGIARLRDDAFTCLSPYSDTPPAQCREITYLKQSGPELVGAFKTPSLRNTGATAPYMHSGQFTTLEAVVAHYNKPTPPTYDPDQHPNRPHFDILPLNLTAEEQRHLIAFLNTLTAPLPLDNPWYHAPGD